MAKRNENTIEDRLFVAERQYDRMMENVNQGFVNIEEILAAMSGIQTVHYIALKQNPRYLIDARL